MIKKAKKILLQKENLCQNKIFQLSYLHFIKLGSVFAVHRPLKT